MTNENDLTIDGIAYPRWVVETMYHAELHYRAEVPVGKRKNRDDKWREGLLRDFVKHSYPKHLSEYGNLARIRNAYGPRWLTEKWPDLGMCTRCGAFTPLADLAARGCCCECDAGGPASG